MIHLSTRKFSPKPGHMSWEEAAALPLAALTGWRALISRAGLARGERVLVNGIGGGVALFALQVAVASGNEAWVTSSSDEKIARANDPDEKARLNALKGKIAIANAMQGKPSVQEMLAGKDQAAHPFRGF